LYNKKKKKFFYCFDEIVEKQIISSRILCSFFEYVGIEPNLIILGLGSHTV